MIPGWLLLMAGVAVAAGILSAFKSERVWLAFTLVGAVAALTAALWILASGATWDWQPEIVIGGEPLHLRLDSLSAFFLVLLCVVGGAGSVYAREYWPDTEHPRSARTGRVWWSVE